MYQNNLTNIIHFNFHNRFIVLKQKSFPFHKFLPRFTFYDLLLMWEYIFRLNVNHKFC
jgi:hypothetical protein